MTHGTRRKTKVKKGHKAHGTRRREENNLEPRAGHRNEDKRQKAKDKSEN